MHETIVDINSISQLHELYGAGKAKHPLITVIDEETSRIDRHKAVGYRLGLYTIFCKKSSGAFKYGQSHYDFSEGSLMFAAPGQVMSSSNDLSKEKGWALFFHPDLVNTGTLGSQIRDYSFFHYEINEALHLSDEEQATVVLCVKNIRSEYLKNVDKHTNRLIQNNLELLLSYCTRFYDKQFYTREKVYNDAIQKFEKLLGAYFLEETLISSGPPSVTYLASEMNLSPNYLSDLLHRFTGKTALEHIHLQVLDIAKSLLWGSNQSVSEIAYKLGYEHPSHFSRLFKSKTGYSPSEYRHLN
ncbi:helix-turn-helix domain-containing protein [Chryseobacterium sp. Leaf201]|uniref:helix-turn-helix domain-containing protein n=1 Tax=Chryseobacterium sp. Leaf201 TaxID=1735672 RepID=UPI0006FC5311|nr:helix-turn-helix domain-containing protein [Chryseobacterium sp. Leaf201]KQM62953.1 transcriptional regulator [Chryseobacterium sp. Leaf201]